MSGMAELARGPGEGDGGGGGGTAGDGGDVRLPGWRVLVRNELLKARHRVGFWAALLFFLLLVFLAASVSVYDALTGDSDFGLPGAWPRLLLGPGPLGGLFGATALILLISSEWGWKTARQNVIDGLSREQWFVGKALLWLLVGLIFYGSQVLLSGGMAAVVSDFGSGPLVRGSDLVMAAGGLLLVLGYLGTGFLTAVASRSTGAAVGLFFLWVFAEQLLGAFLSEAGGWRAEVARYLPHTLMNGLGAAGQYDPEVRRVQAERMAAMGSEAAAMFPTPVLFALTLGWMAVFLGLAWLAYRRRDL